MKVLLPCNAEVSPATWSYSTEGIGFRATEATDMPGDSASCYQLGFELKAVGTAPIAGLDELVAGVQVTTIF